MKKEFEKQFSEAVKFKKTGQFECAKKMLLDLQEKDPQSTAILAVLGDVCWDMQLLEEAVSTFRRAIELSPTLEHFLFR